MHTYTSLPLLTLRSLVPLALMSITGCRPGGVLTIDTDEGISADEVRDGVDGEENDFSDEGVTGEDSSGDDRNEGWDGELAVRQGTWSIDNGGITGDACGWENVSDAVYGSGFFSSLLPSTFEVTSFDGGFEIEAQNYGARGPIICVFAGDNFSCETQRVRPFDGSPEWEYQVDFEGRILNDKSISGAAVVNIQADSYTQNQLSSSGVAPASCDVDVALELQWGAW